MDPALEARTLAAEDRHWWYRGRRAIVLDAARRADRRHRAARILEAGCGGGGMLSPLAEIGAISAVEPSAASRERARRRGAGEVLDAAIGALPFADAAFDLVLALDVVEHIADDANAMRDLRRVTTPGGTLIVTVPAHPRLWSRHDELNHHHRRYTRGGVAELAEATGWRVIRMTHFNSLLLPAALAARKLSSGDGLGIPPAPVNRTLEAALQLERLLIRARLALPAGLSLIAELEAA